MKQEICLSLSQSVAFKKKNITKWIQVLVLDYKLCCLACYFHQYPALSDYYKIILVTILILMTLIEAIRLYLGYAGNLQQKVHLYIHI